MGNAGGDDDLPFDRESIPTHIAIVMDGNGRWAKARGRSRIAGHLQGSEAVRTVVRTCCEWGVKYLTLYAFSSENWIRPAAEVSALMSLLQEYLRKETEELHQNNIRLKAIGDRERLSRASRRELDRAIERLADNSGLTLILALSYGARDELVRALRSLSRQVARGEMEPEDISEEAVSQALDTAGIPDPDLVIRTAGEMRLSNFLLWQASYAEYYSTPVYWPDFGPQELAKAIAEFQGRTRKFGQVSRKE